MKKETELRIKWNASARKIWPDAEWVAGNGPFALLAHCGVLTICLYNTRVAAKEAKQTIDDLGCGGRCGKHHAIVNMADELFQDSMILQDQPIKETQCH